MNDILNRSSWNQLSYIKNIIRMLLSLSSLEFSTNLRLAQNHPHDRLIGTCRFRTILGSRYYRFIPSKVVSSSLLFFIASTVGAISLRHLDSDSGIQDRRTHPIRLNDH